MSGLRTSMEHVGVAAVLALGILACGYWYRDWKRRADDHAAFEKVRP